MTKNVIRVVAGVVDYQQLTLYKEDGTTMVIPQGDPRLAEIVKIINPILATPGAVAEVDLSQENHFSKYEENSGGLVRFFKVAKKAVMDFFAGPDEEVLPQVVQPAKMGRVPVSQSPFVDRSSPAAEMAARANLPSTPMVPKAEKIQAAVNEIIANATPVNAPEFTEDGMGKDGSHTVVAVVGGKIVPNMEDLKNQLAHANKLGSTEGVNNFLSRLAAVIDQRQHSTADLLNFMKRGDLPIANDGSIVIYKVLRRHPSQKNKYVDCHTRNVVQRIGSHVCMDPSMVDPNRRNECSNGLHVARRQYIQNFSGDVCVIAKVAPEDAIAVPEYDANKMRVCGYHILFELPQADYDLLRQNHGIASDDAKSQLASAISGNHIAKVEEVRIHGQYGNNVKITQLIKEEAPVVTPEDTKVTVKADLVVDTDDKNSAPVVDPKAVSQQVTAAKEGVTRAGKVAEMFAAVRNARTSEAASEAAEELVLFKKKAKVGWERLGLTEKDVHIIEGYLVRKPNKEG